MLHQCRPGLGDEAGALGQVRPSYGTPSLRTQPPKQKPARWTRTSGHRLFENFVDLRRDGHAPATIARTVAYWEDRACAAEVANLAQGTGSPAGDFQRAFGGATGFNPKSSRFLDVPLPGPGPDMPRTVHSLPIPPANEAVAKEFQSDPAMMVKLPCAIEGRTLPPAHHNHPIVRFNVDTPVVPIGIYLHGMPYQKRDRELCLARVDALTSVRHLLAILRKSRVCTRGCKGWCSVWVLFRSLSWSLEPFRPGRFPTQDCLGQPWGGEQGTRWDLGVRLWVWLPPV